VRVRASRRSDAGLLIFSPRALLYVTDNDAYEYAHGGFASALVTAFFQVRLSANRYKPLRSISRSGSGIQLSVSAASSAR
jgi:hypothetical protein